MRRVRVSVPGCARAKCPVIYLFDSACTCIYVGINMYMYTHLQLNATRCVFGSVSLGWSRDILGTAA